jgi:hypothetical protein
MISAADTHDILERLQNYSSLTKSSFNKAEAERMIAKTAVYRASQSEDELTTNQGWYDMTAMGKVLSWYWMRDNPYMCIDVWTILVGAPNCAIIASQHLVKMLRVNVDEATSAFKCRTALGCVDADVAYTNRLATRLKKLTKDLQDAQNTLTEQVIEFAETEDQNRYKRFQSKQSS